MERPDIFRPSMRLVGLLILLSAVVLTAQDHNTFIEHATRFAVSPPLRDLALPSLPRYGFHEAIPVRRCPKRVIGQIVDTVEQSEEPASGSAYSIGADFLGVGNGFPNYAVTVAPPDSNIAVGDTQVV